MNEKEAQEALKEYRKVVKDHIKGNIPFHEDGWGKKPSAPDGPEKKEEPTEFFPKNWHGMPY